MTVCHVYPDRRGPAPFELCRVRKTTTVVSAWPRRPGKKKRRRRA